MQWLTVRQFAEIMQLPESTVRELCRTAQLKCRKFGKQWRIHASETKL